MEKYSASVEEGTSSEELEQIKKILEETGVEWKVDPAIRRESLLKIVPWIIVLYLSLKPFFNSFFGELGKDAHRLLKNVLRKLYNLRKAKTGSEGSIAFRDSKSKLICDLPMEMDDKALLTALRKLRKTDLSKFDHGPICYDKEKRLWLPSDEQLRK